MVSAEHEKQRNSVYQALAGLTSAQHNLLNRIAAAETAMTVPQLAQAVGLHVSSVREMVDKLYSLGLLERVQQHAIGRGRPAASYTATVSADPTLPAKILRQAMLAVQQWLRKNAPEPLKAGYEIGRLWGENSLVMMAVPDHQVMTKVSADFKLANHMTKIRTFLSELGFACVIDSEDPTTLVLQNCPFTDRDYPSPLALEMRRGVVEQILERTAAGMADFVVTADPTDPMILKVELIEKQIQKGNMHIDVTFYGGAAEAAGSNTRIVTEPVSDLAGLVTYLNKTTPALEKILPVCSFLVDQRPATPETPISTLSKVDVLPPFAGG